MLRDLFSLFPAYAGVIPAEAAKIFERAAFPRIRGVDPNNYFINGRHTPFSPHMRG